MLNDVFVTDLSGLVPVPYAFILIIQGSVATHLRCGGIYTVSGRPLSRRLSRPPAVKIAASRQPAMKINVAKAPEKIAASRDFYYTVNTDFS